MKKEAHVFYKEEKALLCSSFVFYYEKKNPTNLTQMKVIHHSQNSIMTVSCNTQMERKKLQKKVTRTKLESDSLPCVLYKL